MELWVRSQNKESLSMAKNIKLDKYIGNKENTIILNDYLEIGKYKSKERALEVLNEIQEAQLGNYHYKCPSNVKVSNNGNTIVYEMPKE